MFPMLLILIGIAVLVFGKRLAVLGAAVGALLGVGLLSLFSASGDPLLQFAVVGLLAVLGAFVGGFAKGLVNIIVLVLGALAGAGIVLGFLDLFNIAPGPLKWLLAVVGGVVGLILIRRSRKGSQDWGMIILAGLVGALLVTRGLTIWLPALQGVSGTLIVLVLAGVSIAFQGGYLSKRKATAAAQEPSAPENQDTPPTSTG
jgi:hypothetical protein